MMKMQLQVTVSDLDSNKSGCNFTWISEGEEGAYFNFRDNFSIFYSKLVDFIIYLIYFQVKIVGNIFLF